MIKLFCIIGVIVGSVIVIVLISLMLVGRKMKFESNIAYINTITKKCLNKERESFVVFRTFYQPNADCYCSTFLCSLHID